MRTIGLRSWTVSMDRRLTAATLEAMTVWPGSLRELARRADVPDSTLVRMRQGKVGATPDTVVRLLDAYEATQRDLKRAGGLLSDALL
jgi:hypothetical protein